MDTKKQVTFFVKRNLVDPEVEVSNDPWNIKPAADTPWGLPKPEWNAWLAKGNTDHCLYSMIEPAMPGAPVSKTNEARFIHGFVTDYDGYINDPVEAVNRQTENALVPNYITVTKSGKGRLIWMFEEPIRVLGNDHADGLLKLIGERLHADKWLPALDKKTFVCTQYWDIGQKWVPTAKAARLLRPATTETWQVDYFLKNIKKVVTRSGLIPMADLASEAIRRNFQAVPNFEAGAHCRRFWDPRSDNDNGCYITEHGVLVFVPHDKPFMSWRDIFGPEFVSEYEKQNFAGLFSRVYFNHKKGYFLYQTESGEYITQNKTAIEARLSAQGVSKKAGAGTGSEMDEKVLFIMENNFIDREEERLFQPLGLRMLPNRLRALNMSRIKVMQPGPPMRDPTLPWKSVEVANMFPFLHGLLTHMFDVEVPGHRPQDPTQLDYLLWHTARFYRSGYYSCPCFGHAVFVAGGPGQGKSLLAQIILPRLMGGDKADVTMYMTGDSRWTGGDCVGQPVLSLSDGKTSHDDVARKVGEILKKGVADGALEMAEKYGREGATDFFGRFIITLNTDYEAMRILPHLTPSMLDKFIYLLAKDGNATTYDKFGTREENEARIMHELPAFARYLLDMPIPEEGHPLYDVRFGFKSWQHPQMLASSSVDDRASGLFEAMDSLWGASKKRDSGGRRLYWTGTAHDLWNALACDNEAFKLTIRTPVALGRELARMADAGYDIKNLKKNGSGIGKWKVYYGVADDLEDMKPTGTEGETEQ